MKKIFVVLMLICASQLQAAPCPEQVVVRNAPTWGNVQRATPTLPRTTAAMVQSVTQRHTNSGVLVQRASSTSSPYLSNRDDPYDVTVSPSLAASRPRPQQDQAELR